MQRSSNRVAMGVNVAVKAATIALLLVALASPDLPQFQGKAFTGRAIAYPIALAVVPVAWWLFGRGRMPYPVAVDILIGLLLRRTTLPAPARAGIAVGWAATTAILWELAEYVAFVPGSAEASTAYADTLGDLALGLLGGTIAAVASAWWPRDSLADDAAPADGTEPAVLPVS